MSTFPPITHFAVTVCDMNLSIDWYQKLFEEAPFAVFEEDDLRAAIWIEPMFALHEHRSRTVDDTFDEFRVGLDHIAFGCSTRDELVDWERRLDKLGIERGEIVDAFYGSALAFRDPDNIQLEFFVPIGP